MFVQHVPFDCVDPVDQYSQKKNPYYGYSRKVSDSKPIFAQFMRHKVKSAFYKRHMKINNTSLSSFIKSHRGDLVRLVSIKNENDFSKVL